MDGRAGEVTFRKANFKYLPIWKTKIIETWIKQMQYTLSNIFHNKGKKML